MAEITTGESKLIDQLSERVESILDAGQQNNHQFLIRWIRARDGNLDAAELMLKESIKWRKDNSIDELKTKEFSLELRKMAPFWLIGHDKEGRLVVELPFGEWDVKTAVTKYGENIFLQYTTHFLECIVAGIKQAGRDDSSMKKTQCVLLIDFSGYSYGQLLCTKAIQGLLQVASNYEAHYPEIMRSILVVKAPSLFHVLFAILKPFIAENTISKIRVFGNDKKQWLPAIKEVVDDDQVSERFGGCAIRPMPS